MKSGTQHGLAAQASRAAGLLVSLFSEKINNYLNIWRIAVSSQPACLPASSPEMQSDARKDAARLGKTFSPGNLRTTFKGNGNKERTPFAAVSKTWIGQLPIFSLS